MVRLASMIAFYILLQKKFPDNLTLVGKRSRDRALSSDLVPKSGISATWKKCIKRFDDVLDVWDPRGGCMVSTINALSVVSVACQHPLLGQQCLVKSWVTHMSVIHNRVL